MPPSFVVPDTGGCGLIQLTMTDPLLLSPLRRGWTTGACATAAATAAVNALVAGRVVDSVKVRLPGGKTPEFALAHHARGLDWCECGVIKDAGDDPDVTHGALVLARVRLLAIGQGLVFRAGPGVGTVTLPGLPVPVGAPAINPGPRAMMTENLESLLQGMGADISLSIPGGVALAEKTLNGRLGILGGLSILGTTGVVVPFSCSAWSQAIHRAVDVARALGVCHLAAVTGAASERGVRALFPALPDVGVIEVGNVMGGLLSYLRRHPVSRLTIAIGFAKATKLAAGHLMLHSRDQAVELNPVVDMLADLGATSDQMTAARTVPTALAVLELAQIFGLPLGDAVAARALATVVGVLGGAGCALDVVVFDRNGRQVGAAARVVDPGREG